MRRWYIPVWFEGNALPENGNLDDSLNSNVYSNEDDQLLKDKSKIWSDSESSDEEN